MDKVIEIRGLVKQYGGVTALHGIDFDAGKQQITGLIGPDGSGKSSFMKILLGLLKRDAGELSLFGTDPGVDRDVVRVRAGYMPEVFSLYTDLSVEENLLFSFRIHQGKKQDFYARRDRLYRFNRLEAFARARAGTLSGGMKQKLALSCALMHEPSILVLDEPTTGVDPLSRREFWSMLHELKSRGIAILVSTPYMEEALQCDRIYLMNKGRVLASGEPSELVAGFPGEIVEFHSTSMAPQQLRRELSAILPEYPVFLAGRRVHVAVPAEGRGSFEDVASRTAEISARMERVVPDLEDLFLMSVLTETSE